MEKYEQPGVKINSKPPSKEYKDNYEKIFGKKESWLDRKEQQDKELNTNLRKIEEKLLEPLVNTIETLIDKYDNCTD